MGSWVTRRSCTARHSTAQRSTAHLPAMLHINDFIL